MDEFLFLNFGGALFPAKFRFRIVAQTSPSLSAAAAARHRARRVIAPWAPVAVDWTYLIKNS